MKLSFDPGIFSEDAQRLLISAVAFLMPIFVWYIAKDDVPSISAGYHTDARDFFVGFMFAIGILMITFNGYSGLHMVLGKLAGGMAVLVALYPTACASCTNACAVCEGEWQAVVHYWAAILLFAILGYFCISPLRKDTKGRSGMRGVRSGICLVCGVLIFACLLAAGLLSRVMTVEAYDAYRVLFYAEWAALWLFGLAWASAGKGIPLLLDEDEKLTWTKWVSLRGNRASA